MNRHCIQQHDDCKHTQTTIMRRYRRSVIVGRASYFRTFFHRGSWLLPLLHHVRQQIAVASVLALSLGLIPFLLIWIAYVQTWRFLLHFVIRSRHPQLQLVNTHSLRCALDTHRWPGLAIALLHLDDQDINLSELKDKILKIMQSQIETHSVLRRRLCVRLGCYMWREDDKQLDASGQLLVSQKKVNNDAQLQDLVGTISSVALASDRPPWQVVLIQYGRSWCVLLRAHHLVVDSLPPVEKLLSPTSCNLWSDRSPPLLRRQWATSTVLSTLLSTALFQSTTPSSDHSGVCKLSVAGLTRRWISTSLSFPIKFVFNFPRAMLEQIYRLAGDNEQGIRYFHESAVEIWEAFKLVVVAPHVFATQLTSPVENVPLLRASVSPGNRVLAWTSPINKQLVRQVSAAANASEVHILLAACAGALRGFLRSSCDPIPDSVSAILPVIVGESKTPAFALIDLPTGEWDPIVRIQHVSRQMNAVQNRPLHIVIGAVVMRYASCILPQTVLTLALNFLSRRHTVTVCFVDTPIDAMPHHSRLYYWRPPQGNAGLTFTLQSNDECVSLAIASNQSVVSNASVLTSQFPREIHAMAVALKVQLDKKLTSISSKRKGK